jgi:RNA-binding protein
VLADCIDLGSVARMMSASTKSRAVSASSVSPEDDLRVPESSRDLTPPAAKKTKAGAPTPPKALTSAKIRELRGLGHSLSAVVSVGKEGITEGLLASCKEQLLAHELIKIKFQAEAPVDRKVASVELATKLGATLCQVLGRTCLLFRAHPQKPKLLKKEKTSKVGSKGRSIGKGGKKTGAPPRPERQNAWSPPRYEGGYEGNRPESREGARSPARGSSRPSRGSSRGKPVGRR